MSGGCCFPGESQRWCSGGRADSVSISRDVTCARPSKAMGPQVATNMANMGDYWIGPTAPRFWVHFATPFSHAACLGCFCGPNTLVLLETEAWGQKLGVCTPPALSKSCRRSNKWVDRAPGFTVWNDLSLWKLLLVIQTHFLERGGWKPKSNFQFHLGT